MTQNEIDDILTREFEFHFVDKVTGKKVVVSASGSILATLRAHALNSNLTFDCDVVKLDIVPTPERKTFLSKLFSGR